MKWRAMLIVLLTAAPVGAVEPGPAALIRQVQRNMSPADESVDFDMRLIENGGAVSHRKARFSQRQKEPGTTSDLKLIRFTSPPEMDGSAVLTIENSDRADDQWLYLPAYHTSRKIPSSNRADRYMGTDFFYEDVSDDKVEEFSFTDKGGEEIEGRRYAIIEQVPVAESVIAESAYGRKVLWVDPERLVIRRTDFFDKQDNLIKREESSGAEQVEGRWRWTKNQMLDLRINHRTEIDYFNRRLNQGIGEALFTVRSLERGR